MMKVNPNLSLYDYIVMVEDIAEEFFDENNTYCPHIGELNAMRLFYNKCVEESKFDEKYGHNIVNAEDMIEIVADKEFIDVFNRNIDYEFRGSPACCDFCSAYRNARDIVNTRKSSIGNATDTISLMIKKITDSISSVINEDTVNTLSQIGKDMLGGKVTAEAIVAAYKGNIKEDSAKVAKADILESVVNENSNAAMKQAKK